MCNELTSSLHTVCSRILVINTCPGIPFEDQKNCLVQWLSHKELGGAVLDPTQFFTLGLKSFPFQIPKLELICPVSSLKAHQKPIKQCSS